MNVSAITAKVVIEEVKWARRKNSGMLQLDDEIMLDNIELALKKQIPRKVVKKYFKEVDCEELHEEGYTYHCPNCDNQVGAKSLTFKEVFWETNYCCDCSQKLCWEEENESKM